MRRQRSRKARPASVRLTFRVERRSRRTPRRFSRSGDPAAHRGLGEPQGRAGPGEAPPGRPRRRRCACRSGRAWRRAWRALCEHTDPWNGNDSHVHARHLASWPPRGARSGKVPWGMLLDQAGLKPKGIDAVERKSMRRARPPAAGGECLGENDGFLEPAPRGARRAGGGDRAVRAPGVRGRPPRPEGADREAGGRPDRATGQRGARRGESLRALDHRGGLPGQGPRRKPAGLPRSPLRECPPEGNPPGERSGSRTCSSTARISTPASTPGACSTWPTS